MTEIRVLSPRYFRRSSIGMMESKASLSHAPASVPQGQRASGRSRARDATEVGVAYLLILAVEWTARPLQRVLWLLAVAGLVLIIWRSFEGWKAMGVRAANLGRSLWIAGAALGVAAVFISAADRMHTLRVPGGVRAFIATFFAYTIWSGVQQLLLQGVFLLRFLRLIARPAAAAFVAATFFALAHVPNPVLTPITLLWGFVACMLFLRYRNIYPLMIAHAVLGIAVALTVPGPVDHNMRVGLSYLTYNPQIHGSAKTPAPASWPDGRLIREMPLRGD